MSVGRREAMADWLMVGAGLALLASLFLPWSHQVSAALRAQYGPTGALAGVPSSPNAWQVYSAVDVVLALLGATLLIAALRGTRVARVVLLTALLIAVAFTLRALSVPPTNGVNLGFTAVPAGAGPGETLALVALGGGLAGVILSFTADY